MTSFRLRYSSISVFVKLVRCLVRICGAPCPQHTDKKTVRRINVVTNRAGPRGPPLAGDAGRFGEQILCDFICSSLGFCIASLLAEIVAVLSKPQRTSELGSWRNSCEVATFCTLASLLCPVDYNFRGLID